MPEAAEAGGRLHRRLHDDVVGHAPPGTEGPDIALRPVLITGLCIVLFAAAALGALQVYYRTAVPRPPRAALRPFPEPRLQHDPESDLAAMLAEQRARLDGYAWVDRDRGIARLPIEEAMRRLAGMGDAAYAAPLQPERVPALGSRGGASGAEPAPDGRPGSAQAPASGGAR